MSPSVGVSARVTDPDLERALLVASAHLAGDDTNAAGDVQRDLSTRLALIERGVPSELIDRQSGDTGAAGLSAARARSSRLDADLLDELYDADDGEGGREGAEWDGDGAEWTGGAGEESAFQLGRDERAAAQATGQQTGAQRVGLRQQGVAEMQRATGEEDGKSFRADSMLHGLLDSLPQTTSAQTNRQTLNTPFPSATALLFLFLLRAFSLFILNSWILEKCN